MKKLSLILFVSVFIAGGYMFAGPVEAGRISSDADWMVRVDFEQFLKSEVGTILRNAISERPAEQKLENFAKVFGFHPIDNIRNITLYGQGRDRNKAVVLVEGSFDKAKLLSLIELNPEHKILEYSGVEVHQWLKKNDNKVQYGCFYRDDLIILGSVLPEFMQAIDVLKGTDSGTVKEVFNDSLLQNQNAFIQIAATDLAQTLESQAKAEILKQAEQLVAVIGQKDESVFVNVKLTASSINVAENINQILEGVIAFLELSSDERPVLSNLAQKIQLTSSGDTVQIYLESAPGFIQQLILNNIEMKELLK